AAARDRAKLEALIAGADDDISARLEARACDATEAGDVTALFGQIAAPDLVVFNAGAFVPEGVLDITPETFERVWRVGCFGGFLVGQAAARRMVERGSGTIIFTGATASLRG